MYERVKKVWGSRLPKRNKWFAVCRNLILLSGFINFAEFPLHYWLVRSRLEIVRTANFLGYSFYKFRLFLTKFSRNSVKIFAKLSVFFLKLTKNVEKLGNFGQKCWKTGYFWPKLRKLSFKNVKTQKYQISRKWAFLKIGQKKPDVRCQADIVHDNKHYLPSIW